jgi:two-component system chemotaxis response regulator CheY
MHPEMPSCVLVADDSGFMHERIRQILETEHEVVATAGSGEEAVEAYREHDPDVATTDVVVADTDGIEITRRIEGFDPDTRIVTCTSVDQAEEMRAAVDAGAGQLVTKPFGGPEVLEVVGGVVPEAVS